MKGVLGIIVIIVVLLPIVLEVTLRTIVLGLIIVFGIILGYIAVWLLYGLLASIDCIIYKRFFLEKDMSDTNKFPLDKNFKIALLYLQLYDLPFYDYVIPEVVSLFESSIKKHFIIENEDLFWEELFKEFDEIYEKINSDPRYKAIEMKESNAKNWTEYLEILFGEKYPEDSDEIIKIISETVSNYYNSDYYNKKNASEKTIYNVKNIKIIIATLLSLTFTLSIASTYFIEEFINNSDFLWSVFDFSFLAGLIYCLFYLIKNRLYKNFILIWRKE
jgi:hypothetical protein